MHMYIHMCIHTSICICTYTDTPITLTYACIHIYTPMYTYVHMYIHFDFVTN